MGLHKSHKYFLWTCGLIMQRFTIGATLGGKSLQDPSYVKQIPRVFEMPVNIQGENSCLSGNNCLFLRMKGFRTTIGVVKPERVTRVKEKLLPKSSFL